MRNKKNIAHITQKEEKEKKCFWRRTTKRFDGEGRVKKRGTGGEKGTKGFLQSAQTRQFVKDGGGEGFEVIVL